MNQSSTQTNTELIVTRDNQLDAAYKRRLVVKHLKASISLTAHVTGALLVDLAHYTAKQIDELSRPVRLDIFDYVHGTHLRSQYFAGIRTQKILAAKRTYGL